MTMLYLLFQLPLVAAQAAVSIEVDVHNVTNDHVSRRWMGCHSDCEPAPPPPLSSPVVARAPAHPIPTLLPHPSWMPGCIEVVIFESSSWWPPSAYRPRQARPPPTVEDLWIPGALWLHSGHDLRI